MRKAAWEARHSAAVAAENAEGQQQQQQSGEGGEQQQEEGQGQGEQEGGSEGEEEGQSGEEGEEEDDACSLASDDDATAATAEPLVAAQGGAGGQPGGEEGEQQEQQFESSVCIVTADFAMQNVIMQVGCLRVLLPYCGFCLRVLRVHHRCRLCGCRTSSCR